VHTVGPYYINISRNTVRKTLNEASNRCFSRLYKHAWSQM